MTSPRTALRLGFAVVLLACLSLPGAATAQVNVGIQIGLPVAPPMVVIQPGVQVVENYPEEVFFTGGWYWARRGPAWYRARRPGVTFVPVETRYVPARLVRLPPGHYKHWRREEAREAKWQAKAERKQWKEHEKAERHQGHGNGNGHGHGHGHGRD